MDNEYVPTKKYEFCSRRNRLRCYILIISKGHISWLLVSLIALTRQKQLAKLSPQCRACLFQGCLSHGNICSTKTFSEGIATNKKWDHKKQLAKIKICCTSIYVHHQKHFLNRCFCETSPKGQFCHLPEMHLGKKSGLITK